MRQFPLPSIAKPDLDDIYVSLDAESVEEFERSMPFVMKFQKPPEKDVPPVEHAIRSIDDEWEPSGV